MCGIMHTGLMLALLNSDFILGTLITPTVSGKYVVIYPFPKSDNAPLFTLPFRTARTASWNTVFKPFCVSAEHSQYFTALISFCNSSPCGYVMGASRFFLSFSIVSISSRSSRCVPTRMMGVSGQWWLISGYHYTRQDRGKINTYSHYLRGVKQAT